VEKGLEMYSIPLIGATAVNQDGHTIGIVEGISHTDEGIVVSIWTDIVPDPKEGQVVMFAHGPKQ